MIVRIGREFAVPAVRVPREPLWFSIRGAGPVAGSAAAVFLAPWLAVMTRRLRAAGIVCNDHVFGIAASGSMDQYTLSTLQIRFLE